MRRRRLWGSAAFGTAAAVLALEAATFRVSFPTDPLGPAAFPIAGAALLAFGAASLWLPGAGETRGVDPAGGLRIVAAAGSFILYAALLAPLGFVVATALEFAILAVLFGGRPLASALAGTVFALLLFGLFVYGLGLPLPLGILERGG